MEATREVAAVATTVASSSSSSPLHIVVFPWLAFGHMIPFLELSKRLAGRGLTVTFVSTPTNAARLGTIPPPLSTHLRVVSLDLPAVDGLPEGAESTADVPPENVGLLKKAFDGLAAPFARLVAEASAAAGEREAATPTTTGFSRKPDWIILDFAHNWIWPIAEEHKIPCAMFSIFPAAMLAFVGPKQENLAHPRTKTEHFMIQPPWIPFSSNVAFRRRHEAEWIATIFRPNASGVSDVDRFWEMEHTCCRLIIHRSCPEAEPHLFPLLTELFAKPSIPAGLLMPLDVDGNDVGMYTTATTTMQWLDEQPEKSVIYIALGSEAPLAEDHVRELALGLELAGVRFLWALRIRTASRNGGHDVDTLLPDGFRSRVTTTRGLVCSGWVPQLRILAHRAVGGFLTHCGWSSIFESLRFALPLVMLPLFADQGLGVQALPAREIGVEVAWNDDGSSFHRDAIAVAVRQVMVEEKGKALARKAKELRNLLGDKGRQEMYLDELVGYLQRYK